VATGVSDESGCPFSVVCKLCGLLESGGATAIKFSNYSHRLEKKFSPQ